MANITQLPGLDALGCGYQTVTGEFANIDSCEEQLFDFAKIGYTEFTSIATGKTYSFPKKFVQYLDKNIRESQTVYGETVEDFVSKLSTSVEIKASYAGFGGSVKADFGHSSEYNRFESYTRLQYNTTLWRLSLDDTAGNHRDFLKDKVRDQIDTIDPNDLYEKYGTHYVNNISVGGRCVTSAVTNKLKCSQKQSFGVYLTTKYEMLVFGASASAEITKDNEYKKFNENSIFKTKITGGDPSAYGTDCSPKFEDWAKTVKDHPMMIDFDSHRGLIPIWILAETEERKKQLKDAMNEYFKTHKLGFNINNGPVFEGRWVTGRLEYNDAGSGANRAFSVYKPELSNGWYWLGQRGVGPDYPPKGKTFNVLAVRPKPWAEGVLSPITTYSQIWDDKGSIKTKYYQIWRPIPEQPVDYTPLGHLFIVDSSDTSKPPAVDTDRLMAVHREFTTQANVGDKIWSDEGTIAYARGSCWKVTVPDEGIDCGFWIGHNDYSDPPNADAFYLKKSAIEFV